MNHPSALPATPETRTREFEFHDADFQALRALVKQMTGSASKIIRVPYEEAYEAGFEDMVRRAPDIAKIQGLIGYRPVLDLPEMLERVIAHERERGR